MTAIFGIAKIEHFAEQGGRFEKLMIGRTGAYGSGEFPPFFHTRAQAEQFNEGLKVWDRGTVVELLLVSP